MTIALLLAFTTKWVFWLLLVACFSFLFLFYSYKKSFHQKSPLFSGNYANQITALRFIISSVTALFITKIPSLSSFMLFGLAILLDGIDGFLARKYKSASTVGALFDKTVDAYFVLLLSFILVFNYGIPFWFLGIGYLHYGYELVLYGLGWQALTIPENPIGKYAAAFLFISLLSPFILPNYLCFPIICLATVLVGYSFALSFFYKFKAASVEV